MYKEQLSEALAQRQQAPKREEHDRLRERLRELEDDVVT